MPKLNGIELLKVIKANPELKGIPVVMLTNTSDAISVRECLEAGALEFVVKSDSTLDGVIQKVRTIFG